MEIQFSNQTFSKQKIVFSNQLAILIGQHGSGKTTILETVATGLKGKNRDFFANNQKVNPGEYQMIYIKDHFDLKEEIKLTKSSPFRNQLLKTINHHLLTETEYQDVVEKIEKLAGKIEKIVIQLFAKNLKAITNEDIILKFSTEKINLENIVDHLLTIDLFDQKKATFLSNTTFNRFLLRMVVFSVLQNAVDEDDLQRPIFLLFDDPELYTNPNTMIQLIKALKRLLKKPNFYLLLASNNVDFLLHLEAEAKHTNWVKNNLVYQITQPQQTIEKATAFYNFLKNNDYQDWFLFQNDFLKIFNKEDLLWENNNFYQKYGRDFFQLFFLDKVTFNVNKTQDSFLTKIEYLDKEYNATINKDKKGVVFLATFVSTLTSLKMFFSERTTQNHPKITAFFQKNKN